MKCKKCKKYNFKEIERSSLRLSIAKSKAALHYKLMWPNFIKKYFQATELNAKAHLSFVSVSTHFLLGR